MDSVKTNAEKVWDFHVGIDAGYPIIPTPASAELLALRERLIDEEYAEVKREIGRLQQGETENFTALMHELADLLYVVYGAMEAFGVDPDPVFAEVHSANMRKLEGPKRADGKQLKPAGWQPADVARVIQEQGEMGAG